MGGINSAKGDPKVDLENMIVMRLYEIDVYQQNVGDTITPPEEVWAKNAFMRLCDDTESINVRSAKVTRKKLHFLLTARYSARLATKMVSIFDWANQTLNFNNFYNTAE